jgi:hypothetical protein
MTGWPPGLMQDDHAGLSRWLATRLDARYILRGRLDTLSMSAILHSLQHTKET